MDPLLVPLHDEFRAYSHCGQDLVSDTDQVTESEIGPAVVATSDQEYHVDNYTFRCPAVCRGAGMLSGELKPTFGATPVPISAKAIGRDELPDFLATEGRALRILNNYPHPGFATLRDVIEHVEDDLESDMQGMSYLVMDAVDGDLGSYIQTHGRLPEGLARRFFRQLVSAVSHAHKHGIVLRHIRLEKIYFSDKKKTQLVFADLQGAVVVPTTGYEAEQYLLESGGFDPSTVDVYALGVVLHVMLTGDYPFNRASGRDDDGLAVSAPLDFPAHSTASVSSCRLINRMFDDDLTTRPSIDDILDDPWMNVSSSPPSPRRWAGDMRRASSHQCGAHVVQLASECPSVPSLGRRRGSIVLEADTDQVVPEIPVSGDNQRTRGDCPKRKAAPVPQMRAPPRRQRIKIDKSSAIAARPLKIANM